jgi:iron complex outermembrane receptor protein
MKKHAQKKPCLTTLILSSGLCSGLLAHSALAQSSPAPDKPAAAPAAEMQSVTITGSTIPVDPDKVAVSVVGVDAEKMEKAGVTTNVLDILRKQVPLFQGRGNTGSSNANNTNQNTAGGSQLQLRNLDTLILVNGRRVAISGIAAIGGKAFVDVNQIPPSAIERIEVLPDGSSAIYGSDAIGGVVNIILKSDYEGGEIGARYGSAAGGYSEQSSNFTVGKSTSDFNFTIAGSESGNQPLYQNKRDFSTGLVGRVSVVPGTVGGASPGILATGINSPSAKNPTGANATATSMADLFANGTYTPSTTAGISSLYDLSNFQTLLLEQKQRALAANFSANLVGKKLVLFGDAEVSRNDSFTQFLPIATTVTVPAKSPFNPLTGNFAGVNLADWNAPKQFRNSVDASRETLGLRGDLGDGWGWEAALVHSENSLQQRQANVIYKTNLPLAIAGGFDASGNAVAGGAYSKVYSGFSSSGALVLQPALDPFARTLNPAALANVLGTEVIDTSSSLDAFDATLHGNLVKLPAGNLGFAVGVSRRLERLSGQTDPNGNNTGPTAQLWLGGTYADQFSTGRSINAEFVEFRVPIASAQYELPGAHALDLVGAFRHEDYSDAGSSSVPKVGFRWQPVDSQLTVRGAYSRSFTAPTLYAKYGPTDTRIVGSGVITTVFGLANPGFNGMDGNNPDLAPSKAQTHSLGLTFKPKAVPGLTLTAEYHGVDQDGYPGGIGFTNILQSVDQLGSASPFAANLAKGNFPGLPGATPFTNPGDLGAYLRANPNNAMNIYAIDRFMNLGGLRVQSYNVSGEYEWTTETMGAFTVATAGTIFQSYKFQALPGQSFYEYAGTATNGGTGVQGTLPKYRFYSSLDWRRDEWSLGLANTYVSSVTDIGPGGIVYETSKTLKAVPVSSYSAWDVRVAYTSEAALAGRFGKGWTLAGGINNITNVMPPLAPQAFTDNNADVASYSPIGRFTYLTFTVKF